MARRIGDILIERGWITPQVLERALTKQAGAKQRLCSFLVACDAVAPDDAVRALGERHGVPAVLQKHLDHRVQALAKLIPSSVARSQCVLPIGRMAAGELIVCVRDPRPELRQLLAALTKERIVLAVGLASRLEELVESTYPHDEFEVDLTTGPIVSLESLDGAEENDEGEAIEELPDLSDDASDDVVEAAETAEALPGLGPLTLVELDDQGVSRDLAQSGAIQIGPRVREKLPPTRSTKPPTLPPPTESRPSPTLPPSTTPRPQTSSLPPAVGRTQTSSLPPAVGRAPTSPAVGRVSTVRTSLMAVAHPKPSGPPPPDDAMAAGTVPPSRTATASVEMVLDKAIQVAAARWQAVLLLAIKDRIALGHRGHGRRLGDEAVRGVAIPLGAASIVKAAYDAGALATTIPPDTGAVQDRLERLLAMPRFPAAMPITINGAISFILVVGDPNPGVPDATPHELERLGTEFAAALARLAVT